MPESRHEIEMKTMQKMPEPTDTRFLDALWRSFYEADDALSTEMGYHIPPFDEWRAEISELLWAEVEQTPVRPLHPQTETCSSRREPG